MTTRRNPDDDRTRARRSALACALGIAMLAGCSTLPPLPSLLHPDPPGSLYEQLGDEAGVGRLVDRLLREIASDDSIAHHFRGIDVGRFRRNLGLHLCELANGPCRFEGESMRDIHRGMAISQRDLNQLVEHLIHAMESLQLPVATQNELLAKLAPLQTEIVERRFSRTNRAPAAQP